MLGRLRRSSFARRVGMLAGSIAVGQMLVYATSPLLTRLYTPSEFGIVASYFAALAAVSFLGSFNYELAVPIAQDDEEAVDLVVLGAALLAASSVVLLLAIVLVPSEWLTVGAATDDLSVFVYVLPLGLLFVGLYGIFVQWAYRTNDFRTISRTRLWQSGTQVGLNCGLGLVGAGSWGLLAGRLAGQSAGTWSLVRPLRRLVRSGGGRPSRSRLRAAGRRYRNFALFTTPRRYLGDMVLSVPILFLTASEGAHTAGLFSLAVTTVQLPLNIIGDSISGVYLADSARYRFSDPAKVRSLGDRLLVVLVVVSLLVLAALWLLGPPAFEIVYGAEWREAGVYALLLWGATCGRFIFKPLSNVYDIFERQATFLVVSVMRLVMAVAALGVCIHLGTVARVSVLAYSVAVFVGFALQYVIARRILTDAVAKFEKQAR